MSYQTFKAQKEKKNQKGKLITATIHFVARHLKEPVSKIFLFFFLGEMMSL